MSYVRLSEKSDVYVYLDVNGYLCCCFCKMNTGFYSSEVQYYLGFYKTDDMIEHLKRHKKMGHKVPKYCFDNLKHDSKRNDKWIKEKN